jgi:hypothetical protein
MASHNVLQKLDRLERSSPKFHDKLSSILYGEEYMDSVQNLQGGDLVWFVDYLDKVWRLISFPYPPLKPT